MENSLTPKQIEELNYMQYPITTVKLADELKRAVSDYTKMSLSNTELTSLIVFWSKTSPELFFDAGTPNQLKKSITTIIGKRRADVVTKILLQEGAATNEKKQ